MARNRRTLIGVLLQALGSGGGRPFDAPGIVAVGVHPLLIFLTRMHVERERPTQTLGKNA